MSADRTAAPSSTEWLAGFDARGDWFARWPFGEPRRGVDAARLRRRLTSERDALLAAGDPLPGCHLLVAGDPSPRAPACADWASQSHPFCSIVPCGESALAGLPDDDWLFLAAPQDRLHPALAATLMLRLHGQTSRPCAWTWNEVRGDPGTAVFLRKPGPAAWALLGGDWIGRSMAVTLRTWREAPEGARTAWREGRAGPMALWLAAVQPVGWRHHPEFLSALADASLPAFWPDDAAPAWRALARTLADEEWQPSARGAGPEAASTAPATPWVPARVPQGVSVVIPFRDAVAETLEAVTALAGQRIDTWIEVLLVDNGSRPDSVTRLEDGLAPLAAHLRIRRLSYDAGFNHSHQCNLGARAAAGEVVVILNNDAVVLDADVLDGLGRWALLPGVATVGPRIVDDEGRLVCAGIRARLKGGYDFEAAFEESRDPVLCEGLREVAGNTGACFAIRKQAFEALGGFDSVLFPIGFNDVDLACRARARGLAHLSLGWVKVRHQPGGSRGKTDEVLQKVILRERYVESARFAQFQLGLDAHLRSAAATRPATAAAPSWRASVRAALSRLRPS